MHPRLNRLFWALPLSALLFGCAPKIGKSCSLSTDCSQLGDRLCDTNQPEGYCTIFNCEPDTCPDSACVGFYAKLIPSCGSATDDRTPRFERTFCMASCKSDGDCRDGYQCVKPEDRAAEIVDAKNASGVPDTGSKVCMPPEAPDPMTTTS